MTDHTYDDVSISRPAKPSRGIDCRETIVLRLSEPADGPAVHLVWTRAMKATHRFLSLEHFEELSDQMRQLCGNPNRYVLAICENIILGFMGLDRNTITALYIDPLVFRQGIGRRLVQWAGQEHDGLDITIYEQNLVGRSFCARLGFENIERIGHDADGRPYTVLHLRKSD